MGGRPAAVASASHGTSGARPGGRMTWLSQRKRPRRRRGAGEATERAVSAAAPRSQRRGPGPVRLSAPGGCESAAAAAESVGGRRAGGSAEDEAAAGRSRRGGGRRAAAAAAAPGPGGRARAHGERRPRADAAALGLLPASLPGPGPARPAKPGGPVEPVAVRGRLPVGPGGAGTRAPGGGMSMAPGAGLRARSPGPSSPTRT